MPYEAEKYVYFKVDHSITNVTMYVYHL